jgi:hypothetical protein
MDWQFDLPRVLCAGPGDGVNTACWMTAVSMYAGKGASWRDQPACVCRVIRPACVSVNDMMTQSERVRYIWPRRFLPVDTATTDFAVRQARACIAADYTLRVFAPAVLDTLGRSASAKNLRALPPVTNLDSAKQELAVRISGLTSAGTAWIAEMARNSPPHAWGVDAALAWLTWADARTPGARQALLTHAVEMIEKMCAVGRPDGWDVDHERALDVSSRLQPVNAVSF